MPTPKYEPTDTARAVVRALSGYGVKGEEIAKHPEVRCSVSTLHKYFREELDEGDSQAQGKIGEALFKKAMAGDTTALIFLAKCRIGLKETVRSELTGPDGKPLQPPVIQFVRDADQS